MQIRMAVFADDYRNIQAFWVKHTRTGSTFMSLEKNACVYWAVEVDNTSDAHGLIDL